MFFLAQGDILAMFGIARLLASMMKEVQMVGDDGWVAVLALVIYPRVVYRMDRCLTSIRISTKSKGQGIIVYPAVPRHIQSHIID